uniref:Homoserine dehydrogenase n=1 Tax=Corethron hystrix TaxID=216773 RepID=A0A7S1FSL3_9STRA
MARSGLRRIGIFGGGTVGGGIVEILRRKQTVLRSLCLSDCGLIISKICVRDPNKPRDFVIPEGCSIVTDYDAILSDPAIDVVVEVMGGVDEARGVVFESLRAGKDVVTANKALIAKYLPEIDALVQEVNAARERPVEFRYEAAVCGGIPVIRSLLNDFVGDDVTMLAGIVNGCTNFVLTGMERDGWSYEESLARAAELGYAESDPALDVGGFDARSKLRILMRLAFGLDVDENEIAARGIRDLTKDDFEYARMLGGTIKIMGVARTPPSETGTREVSAYVSPVYVAADDAFAHVSYATNAVEIVSENLQATTLTGQGAGRYPTANSCVNDILALARGDSTAPLPFGPKNEEARFVNDFTSQFYVRLNYSDTFGIVRQCGEICEECGVGIHSLLQNPVSDKSNATFVMVTNNVPASAIKRVAARLEALSWCKGQVFHMPVLREGTIK